MNACERHGSAVFYVDACSPLILSVSWTNVCLGVGQGRSSAAPISCLGSTSTCKASRTITDTVLVWLCLCLEAMLTVFVVVVVVVVCVFGGGGGLAPFILQDRQRVSGCDEATQLQRHACLTRCDFDTPQGWWSWWRPGQCRSRPHLPARCVLCFVFCALCFVFCALCCAAVFVRVC